MQKAFSHFPSRNGLIGELDRQFPSYLTAWQPQGIILKPNDTHFGYVHRGSVYLEVPKRGSFRLREGMYFCVPGEAEVYGGHGIVMSREEFNGMFQIGGPIERKGRLRYIDGCTDSLLVPPVMMGDPCLNLLYFPPGIDQTQHTHPSDRIGMIMSGNGQCHYRDETTGMEEKIIDLTAGMIFCIHTGGIHKFSTPFEDEMRVLAYHPDSDFGPTHQEHPMLNRTIVGGVSAKDLPGIQTTAEQVSGEAS